jgi:phenylacetate-coenzyme A ligase PaaK-like adenylate-forming protein
MFPQDAAFLSRAFGVSPRVIYQAKEGFLAAGCASGQVHWNEDLIYLERLELGGGRFVPVITDFARVSQTYRRFRMDDILAAGAENCACGQPFASISAVEGRAQDVLLLDGGARCLFPLEVNEVLRPHLNADFCLTQSEPDHVTLAIEGGASDEARDALTALVRPARVSVVDYEPVKPGEKRRRVKRLFDPHNGWLNRFTVSRNALAGS